MLIVMINYKVHKSDFNIIQNFDIGKVSTINSFTNNHINDNQII